MKKVIVILLTVFTVNSSMAETSALPTYEQALKLATAAWKSPPRSIDVTYYITAKDNTRTEEKLRQIYKGAFDKEYGPDEQLNPDMLERKEREILSLCPFSGYPWALLSPSGTREPLAQDPKRHPTRNQR